MSDLVVRLFGRLEIEANSQKIDVLSARRAQELFAFLLFYQDIPHTRETVADMLWPESTPKQSMKYLRHAIWQLHSMVDCEVLVTNGEWLQINPQVTLWLDVSAFQATSVAIRDVPGVKFEGRMACEVDEAIALYRGELFEGCYQDWCLIERERMRHLYLSMLDKLMSYCLLNDKYEAAIDYGARALRCDMAHERIHRHLMQMHVLAGNRAAALRQYEQCVAFLNEELGISPSARTKKLYHDILEDKVTAPMSAKLRQVAPTDVAAVHVQDILTELLDFKEALHEAEENLQRMIHAVEEEVLVNG